MNLTLNIEWTFDELAFIMKAVEEKQIRDISEKKLFDTMSKPLVTKIVPKITEEVKPKSRQATARKYMRAVDILMGSIESWFAYHKTFESITAVAKYLGQKHAANISPYLQSWKIFKEIYKFKFHV